MQKQRGMQKQSGMQSGMQRQRFSEACDKVINIERAKGGIGTLGEKTLHAILKYYIEPVAENHEIRIGTFVADIANEDGVIEIQTANFNKLRNKLERFLGETTVTVVYPIASIKWLVWLDHTTGECTKKRKSPKKGTPFQVFYELYKIKSLLTNEKLKLHIIMLDIEEYRLLNGWSEDKKKGSSRFERIPIGFIDEIRIDTLDDYWKLIPAGLALQFTAKDFKKASGLSLKNAQIALHVLHHLGAVKRVAKVGNSFVYEIKSL